MIHPDRESFKSFLSEGNLIPVYKEILADTDTPVSAAMKLGGTPSFLLESVVGGEKWARYSFLGSRPSRVIKSRGNKIEIIDDATETKIFETEDPLEFIKREIIQYKPVSVLGLPRFYGGLVGYIGYDMVRYFESIPDEHRPGLELPDMFFMVSDTVVIFDNLKGKIKVVSNTHVKNKSPEDAYREAEEKIEDIIERLRQSEMRSQKNRSMFDIQRSTKDFEHLGYGSSFVTKE